MNALTDNQMKAINIMLENIMSELENGVECYIQIVGGDKYITNKNMIRLYKDSYKNIKKDDEYIFTYGNDYIAYNSDEFLVVKENQIDAVKILIQKALHKYTIKGYYCGGEPDWVNYNPNTYQYIINKS